MKILPFTPAPAPLTLLTEKAPRLSCCCRISELVPLVRQLHNDARNARLAREFRLIQQAA